MHTYLGSPANQSPVINEGTAQNLGHLQGHEATVAFPAVAQEAAPVQAFVENAARGIMAQIKVTALGGTENNPK